MASLTFRAQTCAGLLAIAQVLPSKRSLSQDIKKRTDLWLQPLITWCRKSLLYWTTADQHRSARRAVLSRSHESHLARTEQPGPGFVQRCCSCARSILVIPLDCLLACSCSSVMALNVGRQTSPIADGTAFTSHNRQVYSPQQAKQTVPGLHGLLATVSQLLCLPQSRPATRQLC